MPTSREEYIWSVARTYWCWVRLYDFPEVARQYMMKLYALANKEAQDRKLADKKKHAKLQGLGFEAEHAGEILF